MFEIKMPKLGESVEQATITKWFVSEGDAVEEDDNLLEIATDKVDSEIPSPVEGTVEKILFGVNDLVPVGSVIALIRTDSIEKPNPTDGENMSLSVTQNKYDTHSEQLPPNDKKFLSPLVKKIALENNIPFSELNTVLGSGTYGRIRKDDVLSYISSKKASKESISPEKGSPPKVYTSISSSDEIVQMDRMRKLISEHMVRSKEVAAHVTNMVEADVTNIVKWRERMKGIYQSKYKTKLTYMPIFTEAAAKALRDFPMVNSSVDGDRIILKGEVNIGIAVAKSDGNLIVPVIRNADKLNLSGLSSAINQLAEAARAGKLSPDDIQHGTFSISNFGSFRNLMGTPIISQPQVAILATGSIEKKPAVVETEYGDIIVPRHKMFLSLSYDHRIIDGALGGAFLRRIADYLEQFDTDREV